VHQFGIIKYCLNTVDVLYKYEDILCVCIVPVNISTKDTSPNVSSLILLPFYLWWILHIMKLFIRVDLLFIRSQS